MWVVGPGAPALMATWSSPVWMKQWVMVTLVEFRSDGHAVAGIEMVVRDRHVGGGPGGAGLDGDLVVAGVDEAVGDGDVGGIPGVDAIGIAGGLGGVDDHAPCGEAVAAAVRDVEVGGILQGDAIEIGRAHV